MYRGGSTGLGIIPKKYQFSFTASTSGIWWDGIVIMGQMSFIQIFIGPETDHCVPLTAVTQALSHRCCWDLTDVTLACEDANWNLLDVVNVADIDAEEGVDYNLVKILKLSHLTTLWSRF